MIGQGHPHLTRLVALLLAFSISGCGTIFGLSLPRSVQFETRPHDGATLVINGEAWEEGTTPCEIALSPGKNHRIEARLESGGKTLRGQASVTRSIRIWVTVMDAAFTLGLGLLVDYMTGALYRFNRDLVVINIGHYEPPPKPPPTVAVPPPADPPPGGIDPDAPPCAICGEPRGEVTPCPHCGMD